MRKNFFILFGFIFLISGFLSSLTFEEAVRIAFANNSDLKTLKEVLKEADLNVKKSGSAFLPTLDFNGRYTRVGVIPEFEIPGMGSFRFGTPNNYDFRVTAQYLLFDWNRRKNIKSIAENSKKINENSYESLKKRLVFTIAVIFYTHDILNESKKVFIENLNTLKDHLKIVKKRFEAGVISSYEVLSTKVQISKTEAQIIDIDKGLKNLQISLKQILNSDDSLKIEGKVNLPPFDFDTKSLLNLAYSNREDMKNLLIQKSLIDLNLKINRTALLPQLALQANYQLRNGMLPDVEKLRSNWNINLILTYRIFDGFNSKYQKSILQTQKREIELKIDSLKREIKTEIEKEITNIKSLEKSLSKEKEKLKLAEEAYKTVEEAYKEGAVSNIDVLNANSNLKFAKLSVLKIKNQILQEKLKILNLIGLEFWREK